MSLQRYYVITLLLLFFLPGVYAAQSQPSREAQILEHNRKAQEYLRASNTKLAIPELQKVVELNPRDIDAQGNLGVLLYFQDECRAAAPHLDAAVKLDSSLAKIRMLLGICEKRIGDSSAAQTDLEIALSQVTEDKNRIQDGMELIDLYADMGNLEKAAHIAGDLHNRYPTDLSILYTSYKLYSSLAGEAMISISLVNPHSAQMHEVIGSELIRMGDRKGAIAHYRDAMKIDPELPGLHFELAEALNSMQDGGNRTEAVHEYKAALAANPQDEKSERRLGELAMQQGDVQQAYSHYERANTLQPNDLFAAVGLAQALEAQDQPSKAMNLLRKVVSRDPSNAIAHYRLSSLYRKAGRVDDAKREMKLFQEYRELKSNLTSIYRQMRFDPEKEEQVQDHQQ